MKTPQIKKLNLPELINSASDLPRYGKLAISKNKLVYLDIDDAYIHLLYPLLKNTTIQKPDYFGEKSAGAHISVIYPDENKILNKNDLDINHKFIIKDIVSAQLDLKIYYVLMVESVSLLGLRRQYGLSDLLCFKGFSIGFHITIGVTKI